MPERTKLTEKVLREAVPIVGRDYQIFDTDVRGFAACIYRGGGRAFTIDYRHAGRQRRMTFGRWPEWSVSAARARAKEIRREIDAGGDPLAERGALREAPRVNDLIERYCAQHLPKLAERNAADQRASLAKLVAPVWGRKLVTEITATDVDKLLNKVPSFPAHGITTAVAMFSSPNIAFPTFSCCVRTDVPRVSAQTAPELPAVR